MLNKIVLLLAALLIGIPFAQACDVCGSAGGNYLGILPQFQQHFVGVRYQYQSFSSEHPHLFEGMDAMNSEEYFHTMEIWGRFYPHPRVQVFGFILLHRYEKREESSSVVNRGLEDVSFLVNYVLLNTGDSLLGSFKHSLQVGGGLKLPTGRNDIGSENQQPIANLQPGTGSWDITFNTIYTVRYNRLGLNNEFSYRINTVSNLGYKFGDRMGGAMRFFYWQNAGKVNLLPQAGIQYEFARKDYINFRKKEVQNLSGGSRYYLTAGIDAYFGSISTGIRWTQPIHQDFANGYIKNRNQLTLNLIYMF